MSSFLLIPVLIYKRYQYYFNNENPNKDDNGGRVVAETLQNHGVKYIFTLPGGHISPIIVAAKNLGIRIVDVRNEANAVFAADSISRLSNNIGVAVVTAGPGLTNTITAVKNA